MLTTCRLLHTTGLFEITSEMSVGIFISPQNDTKTVQSPLPLVEIILLFCSDKLKKHTKHVPNDIWLIQNIKWLYRSIIRQNCIGAECECSELTGRLTQLHLY